MTRHLLRDDDLTAAEQSEILDLAVARRGIGFGDAGLSGAQRFHLGAGQHEARLERLVDRIVEPRLAIVGDDFAFCFGLGSNSDCVSFELWISGDRRRAISYHELR